MLTTLDRAPPPIFRQGYSALTKLVFFSAVSLFLMAADNRLALVVPLRAAIANTLNPAQRALLVPVAAAKDSTEYLKGLREAKQGEETAKAALATQALKAAEADKLAAENQRLRALLELKPSLTVRYKAAEVLYEANDPFSRKFFIDQGTAQGVLPGSPVVTERGVVGQVTRVYRISAEVTLVVDRNAAVPVVNARTQQRLAAYGAGDPLAPMELRFVSSAADVQVGDTLTTSGLDGVYPPGLNVAKVKLVERNAIAGGFTRVVLEPAATLDTLKHVLVLDPLGAQMPERPIEEPESIKRVRGKRGSKDAKAAAGKEGDKGPDKPELLSTEPPPDTKPEINGRTAP
jgi:rod shape-determining protein MreC